MCSSIDVQESRVKRCDAIRYDTRDKQINVRNHLIAMARQHYVSCCFASSVSEFNPQSMPIIDAYDCQSSCIEQKLKRCAENRHSKPPMSTVTSVEPKCVLIGSTADIHSTAFDST